jgi:hypothetical protein
MTLVVLGGSAQLERDASRTYMWLAAVPEKFLGLADATSQRDGAGALGADNH